MRVERRNALTLTTASASLLQQQEAMRTHCIVEQRHDHLNAKRVKLQRLRACNEWLTSREERDRAKEEQERAAAAAAEAKVQEAKKRLQADEQQRHARRARQEHLKVLASARSEGSFTKPATAADARAAKAASRWLACGMVTSHVAFRHADGGVSLATAPQQVPRIYEPTTPPQRKPSIEELLLREIASFAAPMRGAPPGATQNRILLAPVDFSPQRDEGETGSFGRRATGHPYRYAATTAWSGLPL